MYRRVFKGIWRTLILLLVIAIAAIIALYLYVRPDEPIGWASPVQVPLRERIEEIIDRRALEITITEAELNGYAAEEIRQQLGSLSDKPGFDLLGLHIGLQEDVMKVLLQAELKWNVRIEASIDLKASWDKENQQLIVVPTSFRMKDIPLPVNWLPISADEIAFSLDPYLPKWVEIKEIKMFDGSWRVRFGLNVLQ